MQSDLHANKYIYTVNCLLRSLREICNSLLLNLGSREKKYKYKLPVEFVPSGFGKATH